MKLQAPKNFGGITIGGTVIDPAVVAEDGSLEVNDGSILGELLSHGFAVYEEPADEEPAKKSKKS